jgi:hypothetical protein
VIRVGSMLSYESTHPAPKGEGNCITLILWDSLRYSISESGWNSHDTFHDRDVSCAYTILYPPHPGHLPQGRGVVKAVGCGEARTAS